MLRRRVTRSDSCRPGTTTLPFLRESKSRPTRATLSRGVYVHFHDIFYPFEYPEAWLNQGRAWTEAYVLRAFLAFNSAYEIALYNTFLEHFHRSQFAQYMPLCLENEGGSIWLRRSR